MIAEADTVLIGTLNAPADQLQIAAKAPKRDKTKWVTIGISGATDLMGTSTAISASCFYWADTNSYAGAVVNPSEVANRDGKETILLLSWRNGCFANWFSPKGYHLEALYPSTPEMVATIRAQIKDQSTYLAAFDARFQRENVPLYDRVKTLIADLLDRQKATSAFQQLHDLGNAAVPAMILLLDDRRQLPSATLEYNSQHATLQCAPRTVLEALAMVLGNITGEHYNESITGGDEVLCRKLIKYWRLYLIHSKPDA